MHSATEEEYKRGNHATKDNTIGWSEEKEKELSRQLASVGCGDTGTIMTVGELKTIISDLDDSAEVKLYHNGLGDIYVQSKDKDEIIFEGD